ncbi:MAG: hypothetical protein ACLU0O_07970 [Collinsella sp.]
MSGPRHEGRHSCGGRARRKLKFVWQKDSWAEWGLCRAVRGDILRLSPRRPVRTGSTSTSPSAALRDLRASRQHNRGFSLDGLSAKATDGGSPLLGDECELGLSVSGNAGSVRYKFVWEQGGWSRWGSIRQGGLRVLPLDPEVAGDVNIWVDAIDSAGRVTTRKFPVHVDAASLG